MKSRGFWHPNPVLLVPFWLNEANGWDGFPTGSHVLHGNKGSPDTKIRLSLMCNFRTYVLLVYHITPHGAPQVNRFPTILITGNSCKVIKRTHLFKASRSQEQHWRTLEDISGWLLVCSQSDLAYLNKLHHSPQILFQRWPSLLKTTAILSCTSQ